MPGSLRDLLNLMWLPSKRERERDLSQRSAREPAFSAEMKLAFDVCKKRKNREEWLAAPEWSRRVGKDAVADYKGSGTPE